MKIDVTKEEQLFFSLASGLNSFVANTFGYFNIINIVNIPLRQTLQILDEIKVLL